MMMTQEQALLILDIFHVLERLWLVAHCLHPEKSRAAEDYVSHHFRMLLEGKVGSVIGNFRRLLNTGQIRGSTAQNGAGRHHVL